MNRFIANLKNVKTEIIRKPLHFLIALTPSISAFNRPFALALLMMGILVYMYVENLRLRGIRVPLISSLITMASRPRDAGRFVLGPITLGLGALLVLTIFPLQAATIAIYALAFGDGIASLLGKPFGRIRPAFMFGKSLEGSLSCFFAVFIAAWRVCHNVPICLAAALTAMAVEALPLEDFDNIAIPLAVGFVVQILLI